MSLNNEYPTTYRENIMTEIVKRTFKKTANVTLELLKIVANKEYYVRFTSDMHVGKAVAGPVKVGADGVPLPAKAPAQIAFVDDLETDNERIIIISTVLGKELADAYPGASYIGKCFGFKQTKVEGKSYNLVELWEVEDPTPDRSAAVVAAWTAKQAAKSTETVNADTGEVTTTEAAPAATTKPAKK